MIALSPPSDSFPAGSWSRVPVHWLRVRLSVEIYGTSHIFCRSARLILAFTL